MSTLTLKSYYPFPIGEGAGGWVGWKPGCAQKQCRRASSRLPAALEAVNVNSVRGGVQPRTARSSSLRYSVTCCGIRYRCNSSHRR